MVLLGSVGVEQGSDLNSRGRISMSYSMIRKIHDGSLLEVMIVVTPAAVAISAAISFVSIPPVPRLDPNVVVLTVIKGFVFIRKGKHALKKVWLTLQADGWDGINNFNLLRIWVFARVRSVETIDVREEEEIICMNH